MKTNESINILFQSEFYQNLTITLNRENRDTWITIEQEVSDEYTESLRLTMEELDYLEHLIQEVKTEIISQDWE